MRRPVVLVVDDDDETRTAVASAMRDAGADVLTSPDAPYALSMIDGGLRPSLVLTDLSMPEMDGDALCDALHTHDETESIPVVIMSADAIDGAARSKTCGAARFLRKPLRLDALLALSALFATDAAP